MKSTRHHRMTLATGVLVIAAGLRLWQIAQAPPGLHHDEAFHLLRAQEIARGEAFPVYITGNNGNEPLFAYLASVTLTLLGPVTWAGRLTAAWLGLIGVALALRAGYEMFPRQGVGALAGLILASFYWDINFSRFGSQPILATVAAAGTMAFLWQGARTGSYRAYGLAGVCLGLGLTAYVAFRLFLLVPLCAGLFLLLTRPKEWRSLVAGGALAGGVALVIFAPLGLFFIQHPYWFFNRFSQTTETTLITARPEAVLLANTIKTVGGLFWHGDENWRHNLPGRPALDAAQLVFFLIGIWASLRQWRQPEAGTLWVWLVVGLTPSALTVEAPHFGRTTMVTPAIGLLVALGIQTAWRWTRGRVARGLIVVAVALSSALTVRDYFGRWAHDENLFAAFDGAQVWIAQALRTAPDGAALYATPLDGDNWTVEYLLGPEAFGRFRAFNGSACQVMPAFTPQPVTYAVIVAEDANTLPALQAAFPVGTHTAFVARGGQPYLDLYQISPGQTARVIPGVPRQADFGGLVRMLGYTLRAEALKPGSTIRLRVTWQVEQATRAAYKVFVHLIGLPQADGSLIYAQRDVEPCDGSYPTWGWSPGELVMDSYLLPLPEALPGGDYTLQVGWYDGGIGGTGERLAAYESGQPLGDAVKLEQVRIGE